MLMRKTKKANKFKKYRFYDSLYGVNIELCIGDNKKLDEYLDKVHECSLKNGTGGAQGLQFNIDVSPQKGRKIFFIWLLKPDDQVVMAHETIHLIRDIFLDKGVNVDLEKDEESFCYYHSYLMRLFKDKITESKKKPKKKILTKKK